jgi:hypothetical protein
MVIAPVFRIYSPFFWFEISLCHTNRRFASGMFGFLFYHLDVQAMLGNERINAVANQLSANVGFLVSSLFGEFSNQLAKRGWRIELQEHCFATGFSYIECHHTSLVWVNVYQYT